ncbi:ribosomal L27e protein family-domain-containing protein [Ilyonectria sp. MPI-CAGE-AT-0026]|nr:ribosomal L27e protein family-domain-containing protein [Ilyonectria sp. MPI-CAGE-AT-0026]
MSSETALSRVVVHGPTSPTSVPRDPTHATRLPQIANPQTPNFAPNSRSRFTTTQTSLSTFRQQPPDKMKFLKVGRVAIITRGRYAGKKVVIIQPVDNGNKPHPFGHALVAGIERYPSKITRRMSKTRQEKRSKIKPFIKVVNYNHLMPTRYTLELEGLKGTISNDTFKEVSQREDAKKTVKKVLEDRYTSGKNRWFFTPLKF